MWSFPQNFFLLSVHMHSNMGMQNGSKLEAGIVDSHLKIKIMSISCMFVCVWGGGDWGTSVCVLYV